MTRDVQKREELRLVDLMRQLLGGVPAGAVQSADEPDVIVVAEGHRVGIEVTELHQPRAPGEPPRRLQESERAGIVRRAQANAEAAGMPVVDVAVHFTDHAPLWKRDRVGTADALVALVSSNMPPVEGTVELDMWRQPNNPLPSVRIVRIFRSQILTRHHWAVPDSGWVLEEFVAELQGAIDEKNARFAGYMQHCDECWLLVTASGGRPSGLLEPSAETRSHVYRSSFRRTFFMEVFAPKLVELATTAVR